jgi:hypothetical protein
MSNSPIFRFVCPEVLKAALEAEANNQMISPSAYVRRALVRSLAADGMTVTGARSRPADQHVVETAA